MAERVEFHFPEGFIGGSVAEHPLHTIIRALSLKHAKPGAYNPEKYGAEYEDDVIRIYPDYQGGDCKCNYEPEEKAWLAENPHSPECFVTTTGAIVAAIEEAHPLPRFEFFYQMDDVDAAEFFQFWHGGPGPTEEQKARKKAKQEQHESQRKAYIEASRVRNETVRLAVLAECATHEINVDYREGFHPYEPDVLLARHAEWAWEYRCTCGREKLHYEWQQSHKHVSPCWYWQSGQPNFAHKPTGLEVCWYKYIGRDMQYNRESLTPDEWAQLAALVTEDEIRKVVELAEEAHTGFAEMFATANRRMAEMAKDRKGET